MWGEDEDGENESEEEDEGGITNEGDGEEAAEAHVKVEAGDQSAKRRRSRDASSARATPPAREASREDGNAGKAGGALEAFGGVEALELRRRILALVSRRAAQEAAGLDREARRERDPNADVPPLRLQLTRVAHALPTRFMRPEELLDLYVEFMRPLPLPVFAFFVMPPPPLPTTPTLMHSHDDDAVEAARKRNHQFSADCLTYLHRNLLILLLAAPSLPKDGVPLTAHLLATAYLPYAANSIGVADNARVSLVLEALLRGLWTPDGAGIGAEGIRELREAIEMGIEKRRIKAAGKGKRRRGTDGGEEREREEREWLEFSGERMLVVLDMLKA